MPITVHAYTSLENDEVRSQLERLYDTSPEFSDGADAMEQLEQNLAQYTSVYSAEFNSKILGQSGALDRAKAAFWKISWYIRPIAVVVWQKGWSAKSAAWKKKKA